jgi:hypothetical protein
MPVELLTAKDVAAQLRITDVAVYEMVNKRELDVILVRHKRYFTQEIIDKYIAEHTLPAKSKEN